MNVRKGIPFSLFFCLFLIPFLFQNCAQQNFGKNEISSTGTVKLASPFEKQKVIIDFKSLYSKTAASSKLIKNKNSPDPLIPAQSHLVVNINNQCAVGFCENDKNQNSQTCQLFKKYFDVRLKNSSQAYVLVTDKDYTQKEFESHMFSDEVDNYCLVGISQRESYSVNFDNSSVEYLASYHHQIIKTNEVYDFFKAQFRESSSTFAKSQVLVGIVDTGVDFSHSEFPSEVKGKSMNFSAACPTAICNFHGTFVGGIIAAQLSSNQGGFGVALNSIVYSYQVGDKNGAIPSEELINAIKQAAIDGVEILNLSLGSSSGIDASYQAALTDAINKNILIVAAAGNSNNNLDIYPSYPTSFGFDGIVSVGAASPSSIAPLQQGPPTHDQILSTIRKDTFSNYSSKLVAIAAPGTAIFSTIPGGSFGVASGTSFSAPMVTGAMALARGYLKLKDFSSDQISPTLLKSVLYESADILPSLTEKIEGTDVTYFTNNRYLNLTKLKNYVVDYVTRINNSPARIELTGFVVAKNQTGNKTGKFKIEVKDANPTLGLTMRVYTDRNFKTESQIVTAQCSIDLSRKICEFEIPFEKMLIDPEVYMEITDTKGVVISFLAIPKQNLNFGIKEDSDLAGEIIAVSLATGRPVVEGWACLKGFPDKLDIVIRKDDPVTGAIVTTLKPTRQARGNYLTLCDSAEITFGFNWTVPSTNKYYFTAKHPTVPEKNILLKAYAYLPKFNDTLLAEYIDFVQIDKNWSSETPSIPNIDITKFTQDGLQIEAKGSACFEGVYKPTIISFDFYARRIESVFDNPNFNFSQVTPSISDSGKVYGSFAKDQTYTNSQFVNRSAEKDELGTLGGGGSYSEIADYYFFAGSSKLKEGIKNILSEIGSSQRRIASTQFPTVIEKIKCPLPSAFDFRINLSKEISSLRSAGSITYRSDKITLDQIFATDLGLKSFFDITMVDKKFEDLNYNKLSLGLEILTNYSSQALVNTDPFTSPYGSLATIRDNPKGYNIQPIIPYLQFFKLDKSITSTSDTLEVAYESGWITLSYPSKTSLVSFEFDNGSKFGTIGEDFRLEIVEDDQATVTKPVFDISTLYSKPYYYGKMYAEVFTKNKNARIKIRLLTNLKNQFHLNAWSLLTL